MRTIQMTLDEELVAQVDLTCKRVGKSRSALTREALRALIAKLEYEELCRRDEEAYRKCPQEDGELMVRDEDRAWGDPWDAK